MKGTKTYYDWKIQSVSTLNRKTIDHGIRFRRFGYRFFLERKADISAHEEKLRMFRITTRLQEEEDSVHGNDGKNAELEVKYKHV